MDKNLIDIKENYIYRLGNDLLSILLKDRSSKQNIIWATDNYAHKGFGYQRNDQMTISTITGYNGRIIKPRTEKSKKEQEDRIRDKAEVFTPSWICNKQNNLVDNAWFEKNNVFNTEVEKTWKTKKSKIKFPTKTNKNWQDYIEDVRLEITCGEAPYLVSRYDTVAGNSIDVSQRIGLLDRKLRIVGENTNSENEWLYWTLKSYQNVYGYDWQGDNVLLARENLLFTFIDYYKAKFEKEPEVKLLMKIAEILSWNIWQMDGLRFVIPDSCKEIEDKQLSLFDFDAEKKPCPGCMNNDPYSHTGIYCVIKDWKADKNLKFVDMIKRGAYE